MGLDAGAQILEEHLHLGRLLVIFPIVCYFVSPILLNTLITANLYAAIAIPLALMTVGTGRLNFGPNFFLGVGGYTAAILSIAYGWGPLKTLPLAILISLGLRPSFQSPGDRGPGSLLCPPYPPSAPGLSRGHLYLLGYLQG